MGVGRVWGAVCVLVLALVMGACGQKGDLYIPDEAPQKGQG